MNKTETIVAALLLLGWKEVPTSSRKYRTFSKNMTQALDPIHDTSVIYRYVGRSGGLRAGRVSSQSVSIQNRIPVMLRNALDRATDSKFIESANHWLQHAG